MLKLTADPTFEAEVKVTVPGQGAPVPVSLTFKYMQKSQVDEFLALAKGRSDDAVVMDLVVGWGPEINAKFSTENLATFLDNYHAAASEIVMTYFRELTASKTKN